MHCNANAFKKITSRWLATRRAVSDFNLTQNICKLNFLLYLDFRAHSKQNKFNYFTMQDFEEINPHLKDHFHLEV